MRALLENIEDIFKGDREIYLNLPAIQVAQRVPIDYKGAQFSLIDYYLLAAEKPISLSKKPEADSVMHSIIKKIEKANLTYSIVEPEKKSETKDGFVEVSLPRIIFSKKVGIRNGSSVYHQTILDQGFIEEMQKNEFPIEPKGEEKWQTDLTTRVIIVAYHSISRLKKSIPMNHNMPPVTSYLERA